MALIPFIFFTQFTALFFFAIIITIFLYVYDKLSHKKTNPSSIPNYLLDPPSPRKLPIIGHMHILGGYDVPYEAFTNLGRKYGSVVKLQLGNVKSVVVNDFKNIKEVLITKGHHFDSRPNFERYQMLFCGNKENSLAFCNWSETQKIRREMLTTHTFPKTYSANFQNLEKLITQSVLNLNNQISTNQLTEIKPILMSECANIFTNHFCSKNFETNNAKFTQMIENFDDIFYEVNQGYAADFLPFLMPLHKKNLTRINQLTHNIRHFVLEEIIAHRYDAFNANLDEPLDYVDHLIQHVKTNENNKNKGDFSWETALFALEDIIGGHSAIGNFLVKLLGFLVHEQEVQKKIQVEIDHVTNGSTRSVTIGDRNKMPYTEATILEAIRKIASPIVPRVANQDSSINGYKIEKDTLIFLNNYDLATSEKLWDKPTRFEPARFLKNNRLVKPDYFLPFGGGRRSCMGYKMVQLVSFGLLSGILQHFTILPAQNETYKVPIGNLALPKNTFKFVFEKR